MTSALDLHTGLQIEPKIGRRHPPNRSDELLSISKLDIEAACQNCGSSLKGLKPEEADQRLRVYGLNLVTREGKPSILQEILGRAKNPLNTLLLMLATVSYFLGDVRAAIVIAVMVVLAITTAFIQEHRSNEAAAKLRALVKTSASVKRQGADGNDEFVEVPLETLVPGDIVRLAAGDMIPADLRLLEAKDLFVNQSALTGEAMPAEKFAYPFNAPCSDAFDLPNVCFMGANVVSGFATGVIVHTGQRTFFRSARRRDRGSPDANRL